jgi:hypothetical protein
MAHSVYPMEPGGGTWCGANDRGLIFTLLNWHVAKGTKQRTRGEVIPSVLACSTLDEVSTMVTQMALSGMLPFRLIGFATREKAIREWRWDGADTCRISHEWQLGHWFSSGMSDESAEATRRPVCEAARNQPNSGSAVWIRRLHSSHQPERGAFSICVHRPEAATLSYTEVISKPGLTTMRYTSGNPCESGVSPVTTILALT